MPSEHGYAVVSGWYGHGNSGDEAILMVLLAELGRLRVRPVYVLTTRPDQVTRLYGELGAIGLHHRETLGLYGLQHLMRGRLAETLRLLRGARVFILGGGGLLRDDTTWRNLLRLLDDAFLARLFGVPVFFYALGVGPIRTWLGKRAIGWAARRASAITVRDDVSAALLRDIGVPNARIAVVTDPAFRLADGSPEQAGALAGVTEFCRQHPRALFVYPTIYITEPPLAPNDDRHVATLATALDRLCRDDDWVVVLVPLYMTGGDDDAALNRRIRARMSPSCNVHLVERTLPPPAMRALTALATLNVTIRLHAMVYAVSLGLPCVAMDYEPKVAANAARFGLSDYVVTFDAGWDDRLVTAVRRLEARLPAERDRLRALLPELQDGAAATFRYLRVLLEVNTEPVSE
jgi:polysaccharide pyruvyl transferase CsaB